jgi:hypothetical protein
VTSGLVRQGAGVKLAWAVNLLDDAGRLHPPLAKADLSDPFVNKPDLDKAVSVEPWGQDGEGRLLVISRSLICAGWGLDYVPADTTNPPTPDETAAVAQALDHLGYAGTWEIRLAIARDHP